jgi:predicted nuclease of predicted toxin-antitoxin system
LTPLILPNPKAQFLSDEQIRAIAVAESRIIVTKDEDFAEYFWAKGSPPRVLQLKLGNIRNNDLVDIFEANLEQLQTLFVKDYCFVIFEKNALIGY